MSNQELFMWAVEWRIFNLCTPTLPPTTQPELGARNWFNAGSGVQAKQVNPWMQKQLVPVFFGATNQPSWTSASPMGANTGAYLASMNSAIFTLVHLALDPTWSDDKKQAWAWLQNLPTVTGTQGEVPVEVINWASANLPGSGNTDAAKIVEIKPFGAGVPVA